MMGSKARIFAPQTNITLNDLVPQDHFYRHLDHTLDLSFVRELVRDYYAPLGRPSIDPIVFFKLHLVKFFEGIRSARQLEAVGADRLSVRWYLGYDLHQPLPDHSSMTRIRHDMHTQQRHIYQADAATCNHCPLKANCTQSLDGRIIQRSFDEAYLERVRAYHQTAEYQQVYRKRKVVVEPLFGEAQAWHGLGRFGLGGLPKVNGEAILIAAGQNLKRLLAALGWGRRPFPCGVLGVRVAPSATSPAEGAVITAAGGASERNVRRPGLPTVVCWSPTRPGGDGTSGAQEPAA